MKFDKFKNKLKKALNIKNFRNGNSVTYIEAKDMLRKNSTGILLDVRSILEYNEYHLSGAICIPYYEVSNKITNIIEDKNQLIIVYCQSGARSKSAISTLKKMGYTNVYELDGGIDNI